MELSRVAAQQHEAVEVPAVGFIIPPIAPAGPGPAEVGPGPTDGPVMFQRVGNLDVPAGELEPVVDDAGAVHRLDQPPSRAARHGMGVV
ncbi:MAG: hypothetical protein A2X23_00575 [Chloroflexi bacterium GWC2_73_18]|nr:MAG: hypothetical protein A2X23_00575 [Chloroflexi bacterium GWC2_73_18]